MAPRTWRNHRHLSWFQRRQLYIDCPFVPFAASSQTFKRSPFSGKLEAVPQVPQKAPVSIKIRVFSKAELQNSLPRIFSLFPEASSIRYWSADPFALQNYERMSAEKSSRCQLPLALGVMLACSRVDLNDSWLSNMPNL